MSSSCSAYPPVAASINDSLAAALNISLLEAVNVYLPPFGDQSLLGPVLSNLYCSGDAGTCHGICSNADLAGVGVRIAFWLSSTLQAILVAISPEDSTQGAWTSAMLTLSIIIPAIKQKKEGSLTIYHATLVLNFATFSTIVSLAVAPMCAVWRRTGIGIHDEAEFMEMEVEVEVYGEEEPKKVLGINPDSLTNLPRRKVHRQRLGLSLALLAQVCLQWAWAAMLLTDPSYAQTICSPSTQVLMFGYPFTVARINSNHRGLFAVWPLWLLFNVGVTLVWGVLLVFNSSPSVHPVLSRHPSREDLGEMRRATSGWAWCRDRMPVDRGRLGVLVWNLLAFCVALLFLITSEIQARPERNCILGGENTDWGFGQIAAILLAMVPAWAIGVALAKRAGMDGTHANGDYNASSILPIALVPATPSSVASGSMPPPSPSRDHTYRDHTAMDSEYDSGDLAIEPRDSTCTELYPEAEAETHAYPFPPQGLPPLPETRARMPPLPRSSAFLEVPAAHEAPRRRVSSRGSQLSEISGIGGIGIEMVDIPSRQRQHGS